jgi:hypothetical protein
MEQNQPQTLDELLKSEEAADQATTEQLLEVVTATLQNLEGSLGSLHLAIRTLNGRVATLENFVSYLLSKDPEAGPRMKELAEKAEAAAKAQHEQVLSEVPPEA